MATNQHIEQLKLHLKDALFLNLDDFGLEELESGEFSSSYLGIKLNSAFQPIYGNGELFGYEAFLRATVGTEVQPVSPEFAFNYAKQSGGLIKFDRIARTLHVLNFRQIYADHGLLFLNVHPQLLLNVTSHGKVFERILHAYSVPTYRVVIEIPDSEIEDDQQLLQAIDNYRDLGYRIAIDGFGRGHSNLNRIWKLAPEFVKLDNSLIQDTERYPNLESILPRLVEVFNSLGTRTIFKGIETQKQLDIAASSHNALLQGNFLSAPASAKILATSGLIPRLIAAAA
jgi:EAL domain-containing protein (putative c-di-GMP-specific phosphodiesterase class I)